MRIPRIYEPHPDIKLGLEIDLSPDGAGHVGRVLRMTEGQKIILFNGSGYDYTAEIISSSKKNVTVIIQEQVQTNRESPIKIHLAQVISRGDRMDFTLQKSVELGVTEITPLISSRCGVRLDKERMEKKLEQWHKIIVSACEQCGRSVIPQLNPTKDLNDYLNEKTEDLKITLNPKAQMSIKGLPIKNNDKAIRLLIGCEGGLSDDEIAQASQNGYIDVLLGPRILRTETASLTALSILQAFFGDLS